MPNAMQFAGAEWWGDALQKAKVDKLASSYGHGLMLQFRLTDCPPEVASFVINIGHSGAAFDYAQGAPLPSMEGHGHMLRPLTLKMPRAVLAAILSGTTSGLEAYSRGQLEIVGELEDAEKLLNLALSRRFAGWAAKLSCDLTHETAWR
jgi:hypothetical protein